MSREMVEFRNEYFCEMIACEAVFIVLSILQADPAAF
jgi:hypothetical protein